MKYKYFKRILLSFVFIGISLFSPAQNATWTFLGEIPSDSRTGAISFSIGNSGYIGGGSGSGALGGNLYYSDSTFFRYNTNTWTPIANYPGGITSPIAFVIGSKAYVGIGLQSSVGGVNIFSNELWAYDTLSNTWTQMATFPGHTRYGAFSFSLVVGNHAYIGCGSTSSSSYMEDIWEYDAIANTWAQKNNFPGGGRTGQYSFAVGNIGYVGGGNSSSTTYNDFWQYNESSDTWVQLANIPANNGLTGGVSFVIGNNAFVGTGRDGLGNFLSSFYIYNSTTNTWTTTTNFGGGGLWQATGFAIGYLGYVVTGVNSGGNTLGSLWQYDSGAFTLNVTPSPASVCSGNPITLTASGASIYVWSNGTTTSSITVSPTITTIYSVTGTNSFGNSYTVNDTVHVTSSPNISITPSATSICSGGIDTLKANGGVTYVWSNGSTTSSITVSPTSTTSYTVTGTNAQGCSASASTTITLNPTPTITVTPPSAAINSGSSISLTASGANTYTWAPSTGLNTTTGASVNASPTVTTTYTVAGTSAQGCVNSQTITITISGSSCSSPIPLTNDSTTVVQLSTITTWFSFVADSNFMIIPIYNPANHSAGGVLTATLYKGTCLSLDSIMSAILIYDSTTNLVFFDTSLVKGATYYIKAIASPSSTGNFSISPLTGTGRPPRYLPRQAIDSCTSNPCTIVSNGTFDLYNDITTLEGTVQPYSGISFTGYSDVACWYATDEDASYYNSAYNATTPNYGVPSNFVDCSTTVNNENTGNGTGGYVGFTVQGIDYILPNYIRAYITQKLANPLVNGVTYTVSFWEYLPPYSAGYINAANMGMCLSSCYLNNLVSILSFDLEDCSGHPAQPQITAASTAQCPTCGCAPAFNTIGQWFQITGQYTANGTESWITIGNFDQGENATLRPSCSSANTDKGVFYYLDNVSIIPTLILKASPSATICSGSGSSVTLTASPGFTSYTWQPGGLTGQTVTVSPTVTTVYTVTATFGAGCTTYTNTVKVTVDAPTITVNATPSSTICVGANSSVTLTASGASTYIWSPATGLNTTTGATVVASPTVTRVYTVTGTDINGCIGTQTVSVNVAPAPPKLAGPNQILCLGGAVNIGTNPVVGTYDFSWKPTTGLSCTTCAYPLASPITTSTYTETVTDPVGGCSTTASVTVTIDPNCCGPTGTGVAIAGPVNSKSLPAAYNTTLSTTGTTTISGVLTINNNYTISGTNVAMAPNAEIIILPGATLTITGSRLYACTKMWQGIVVDLNGNLNIINNSIVEDAMTACEGENSCKINIVSSLLNNNANDIHMNTSNGSLYSFYLGNSTLTCKPDGVYSPNPYLKPPYASGTVTNIGVYGNDAGALTIGDYSGPNLTNTFSNITYGVSVINTSFSVYNCDFNSLKGAPYLCVPPSVCPEKGVAILASATAPPAADYFAVIGGAASLQKNTMNTCWAGVDITGYASVSVINNTFFNASNNSNNIFSPSPYGDHGVFVNMSKFPYQLSGLQISDNSIGNFETGIDVVGDVFANNVVGGNGHTGGAVFGSINNNAVFASGANGLMSTGILAEYLSTTAPVGLILSITGNSVIAAGNACIQLNNANNDGHSTTIISGNTPLEILPSASKVDRTQRAGILLENSSGYFVANNNIACPGLTTLIENPNGDPAQTNVSGIRSILSNGIYDCNYITEVGQCMRFEGACFPSEIYNNSFSGPAYDGFVLWNSAIVGQQGSRSQSIGETWTAPGTFTNSQTFCYYSIPAPPSGGPPPSGGSPIFVKLASGQLPSLNLNYPLRSSLSAPYILGSSINVTPSSSNVSCPAPPPTNPLMDLLVEAGMEEITTDSIPFPVFTAQSEYISKQAVLNQLNQSPALLAGNAVLQKFKTASSKNNMGAIIAVDTLIGKGMFTMAQNKNGGLAPANIIEQNHKSLNNILLATIAAGVDSLTQNQYSILYAIASQCPLEGGRAVFGARTLLNIIFHTNMLFSNDCDSNNNAADGRVISTEEKQTVSDTVTGIKVYPNPANTVLNIETQLQQGEVLYLYMYSSLGIQVKYIELKTNLTTIPMDNEPSGIYLYRITDTNAGIKQSGKVIVVH